MTDQYPVGTRVIVSIGGMSLVGTVVADSGARVMSNRGPQVQVHFDGRTGPVPVNVRQVIGPVADVPVCGHGIPMGDYGQDCEQCDEGNAESDRWR